MRESALGRARRAKRAKSRSAWRDTVLTRDDYLCRARRDLEHECAGPLHAHHVLPISRGGKDELGNGLTLCDYAHRYVHAHPTWAYDHGYLLRTPGPTL